MARPLLPIHADQVVFLARRGMSVAAIASFFHCDRGTLYKRFGVELRRARSEGPVGGPGGRGRPSSLPPCFGPTCTLYGEG
jgi:hypothetical protein